MFKLKQSTPTGGDCTAGYSVELDKDYSVKDFIENVLTIKGEWGYISIKGKSSCEYKYGKLLSELPPDLLVVKVLNVKASGGWSRMDYYIEGSVA
jgi:hypothetical protein